MLIRQTTKKPWSLVECFGVELGKREMRNICHGRCGIKEAFWHSQLQMHKLVKCRMYLFWHHRGRSEALPTCVLCKLEKL